MKKTTHNSTSKLPAFVTAGLFSAAFFVISFLGVSIANAATIPTLTLTSNNNGSVQAVVAGDPDASIQMFYASSGVGSVQSAGVIGSTGQNGYLSTTLYTYENSASGIYNYNFYNIPAGAPVYVVVDGLESSPVPWPYSGNGTIGNGTGINGSTGTLSLSQTNVNLTLGQSTVVSVYNSANYNYSTTYPLTLTGNTNPSVASVSTLSGNTITITGLSYGSTVLTICSNVNGAVCGTIYVTVSSAGTVTSPVLNGSIYFNPSSISLSTGQSQSVQIYQTAYNGTLYNNTGYVGSYYISSNSNPSVVTASINSNSLYVSASAPGNDTITVCQNGSSYQYANTYSNGACATLTVTVNYINGYGTGYIGYPGITVAPTLPIIQQVQIPLYIPATVYSTPSYSTYPYQGYSGYSSGYGYSNSSYYPY